ncbi:thermonuclease family protein [Sphingobium yanoikuyae]|uniref:thermonuclease family protein n=1 Tax=Sphingobium yanoikuyae TaxID=13690 RepID=UPI000262BCDF|nr:thermonuclease family protein [Sphingobium yanoikuyae]
MIAAFLLAAAVTVVDGDTIRVRGERVHLLGIDAADDPKSGRCQPYPKSGAICDRVRYQASKRSLQSLIVGGVQVQPVTRDHYGRIVGQVYSGGRNLACEQLRRGQAIYKPHWDNGGRLALQCR